MKLYKCPTIRHSSKFSLTQPLHSLFVSQARFIRCSVRKNIIHVLSYLKNVGIQRAKLNEFIKNYPQVLHRSVV